jgi:hypothetical protein
VPSTGTRFGRGNMVSMAALTRGEIRELADRLRDLIATVDNGEMSATTAMRYRLQGAVMALEAVLGGTGGWVSDDLVGAMVRLAAAFLPGRRRPTWCWLLSLGIRAMLR